MRGRVKTKGRCETGRFAAIPHHILESHEYARLTAHEVKLLLDLFCQFNGSNNGDMSAAWSLMMRRGWHSRDTLHRALCGLIASGFIMKSRQGGKHACSLYAVTWKSIDECGGKLHVTPSRVPTNAWRHRELINQDNPQCKNQQVV